MILLLFISFPLLHASELNELQIFNKCYSQLTLHPLKLKHPLVKLLKEKKINASQACINLIEQVNFDKNGIVFPKNQESLNILWTMQKLHDSWFPSYNFNQNTQDHPNTDLYDSNEMGYHFTWNLFDNNSKIDSVIRNKFSFKALRQSKKPHLYLVDREITGIRHQRLNNPNRKWKYGADGQDGGLYLGPVKFWEPELVQFGTLVGLKKITNGNNRIERWISKNRIVPYYTHKTQGGGVIGTTSYLLLNSGHNDKKTNGGTVLHRRWSTAVFKDLLCRNAPLITEKDAKKFVQPNSKISFRRDYKCQMCHVSLDPMAATIRNFEVFNSGDFDSNFTTRNLFIHSTTNKTYKNLPDNDPTFYKTKPIGRVYFRDLDNKLIDVKTTSVADIGLTLSKVKDFYLCQTQRYLNYFIGSKLAIEKIDYARSENNTALENYLRKQAGELQKHGSVKKLIKSLIESKWYRSNTSEVLSAK